MSRREAEEEIKLAIRYAKAELNHGQFYMIIRPKSRMIKDSIYIGADNIIPGLIAELQSAADKLTDAHTSLESYDSWEDSSTSLYVIGWRPMNEEEIKFMEENLPTYYEQQRRVRLNQEARDREDYERLRQRFEKGNKG